MTYFTIFHWIVAVVLILLYSGAFFWMLLKLKGQFLAVGVLVLTLAIIMIGVIASVSLDKKLKKAEVQQFDNKRLLGSEKIMFSGYIVNKGDYTIGKVTFTLKLINNGISVGSVKGSDFYQPNSFLEMIFSIGQSKTKEAKPNTIEIERVIAEDLRPKERRYFSFTIGYPTYFKDVLFREQLTLH